MLRSRRNIRIHSSRHSRFAVLALLALALVFGLGATDPGSRFNDLGHKLMCSCGCSQVLLECNHVGCSSSTQMRGELTDAIASGATDTVILNEFVAKYGATVLAAPTAKGFNGVAWIMPFAVLIVALLGAVLVMRRWKLKAAPAVSGAPNAALHAAPQAEPMDPLRERIRRETDGEL